MPVLLTAMALLGLAVGSFLNVVIHRVPLSMSLLAPGSHCPACDTPVRIRHNIPVLGWLLLRGKCADCRTPISVRYPLIELTTGALFVLVALQSERLHMLPALPAYLVFVSVGIALATIDLSTMRLPNVITYPSYAVLVSLFGVASLINGTVEPLLRALVAGALMMAFYLALAVAKPGGMGFGDVKLAGLIGAVLGFLSFPAVVIGVFAGFVLGGVVGVALVAVRRAGRKTLVPFGPFMIAGALIAFFASAPLVDAYRTFTHTA